MQTWSRWDRWYIRGSLISDCKFAISQHILTHHQLSKGMHTLTEVDSLSKLVFFSSFWKGVCSKMKEFATQIVPFRQGLLFIRGQCAGKQIKSHKKIHPHLEWACSNFSIVTVRCYAAVLLMSVMKRESWPYGMYILWWFRSVWTTAQSYQSSLLGCG